MQQQQQLAMNYPNPGKRGAGKKKNRITAFFSNYYIVTLLLLSPLACSIMMFVMVVVVPMWYLSENVFAIIHES